MSPPSPFSPHQVLFGSSVVLFLIERGEGTELWSMGHSCSALLGEIPFFSSPPSFYSQLTTQNKIKKGYPPDSSRKSKPQKAPKIIESFSPPPSSPFLSISISPTDTHATALTKEGEIYQWGSNLEGLWDGANRDVLEPREVKVGRGEGKFVQVVCGGGFNVGLSFEGEVFFFFFFNLYIYFSDLFILITYFFLVAFIFGTTHLDLHMGREQCGTVGEGKEMGREKRPPFFSSLSWLSFSSLLCDSRYVEFFFI